MIFPGIFALTVAATRGVVLKAFRQIEERTPYDEEVQIKQESRRVLLAGVKGFTLLGVRRKVPKSAIFVCPGLTSEHIFFKMKDRRLKLLRRGLLGRQRAGLGKGVMQTFELVTQSFFPHDWDLF